MKRTSVMLVLLGMAAAAVVLLLVVGDPLGKRERTNIVLITLDTTRADRLGCYGYADALTPALDGLAESGVLFEQALCNVPLTLPSHATMLTGLRPPEHGLRVNGKRRLSSSIVTLAELLKEEGYETGAFIASFALDSKFGLDQGFDTYDDDFRQGYQQAGGGKRMVYRPGNQVTDSALRWIQERLGKPFFCWVHLFDPHWPYYRHDALAETALADQASYDAEIAFADLQVKRVLDFLERRDLVGRTLVVVAGDHGEGLGDHGERKHGYMVYETTLRVPLIFSLPGKIPAGRRVRSLVSLADVFPTILGMVGMDGPEKIPGRPLEAAFSHGELASRFCYGETDLPYSDFGWGPLRSLTTDRWKYIRTRDVELYDRRSDGKELENLASQQPETVAELEAALSGIEEEMVARHAEAVALGGEEKRRLESLGYLGGGRKGAEETVDLSSLKDVKALAGVIRTMDEFMELATTGEIDKAKAIGQEIIRQSPESAAWVQCNLGIALTGQGKTEEAMRSLSEALRSDPESAEAHTYLGLVLAHKGQYAEAVGHLSEAAKLQPEDIEIRRQLATTLFNHGKALARSGRDAESVGVFEKGIALDGDKTGICLQVGIFWMQEGRYDRAAAILRAGLGRRPDDFDIGNSLAWVLATCPNEGIRDGAEAVRLAEWINEKTGKNDVRALDTLAAAYAEAGRFDEAVSTAERAVALASSSTKGKRTEALRSRLALYRSGRAYREEPGKTGAR